MIGFAAAALLAATLAVAVGPAEIDVSAARRLAEKPGGIAENVLGEEVEITGTPEVGDDGLYIRFTTEAGANVIIRRRASGLYVASVTASVRPGELLPQVGLPEGDALSEESDFEAESRSLLARTQSGQEWKLVRTELLPSSFVVKDDGSTVRRIGVGTFVFTKVVDGAPGFEGTGEILVIAIDPLDRTLCDYGHVIMTEFQPRPVRLTLEDARGIAEKAVAAGSPKDPAQPVAGGDLGFALAAEEFARREKAWQELGRLSTEGRVAQARGQTEDQAVAARRGDQQASLLRQVIQSPPNTMARPANRFQCGEQVIFVAADDGSWWFEWKPPSTPPGPDPGVPRADP